MFKFLKLKSSQGPWGPWSKAGSDTEKKEDIEDSSEEIKGSEESSVENSQDNKKAEKKNDSGNSGGGNNGDNDDKKDEDPKKESEKEDENEINKNILGDNISDEEKSSEPKKTIRGPWGQDENNEKYDKIISDLIGSKSSGGGNRGGGNRGGGNGEDFFDKMAQSPKKFISLIILAFLSLWMISGFYKVDTEENAIVLYFGKFHGIATPGLNYHVPYPVGRVIKQRITTVHSEEFGYNSQGSSSRFGRNRSNVKNDIENLMLTGDENIVDIEFQVQWQIRDIEDFTFNIEKPRLAIRKAAESAMREVIAITPISEALSDGKSRIEQDTKELLQQILDSYSAGVRITLVQLRRVDPPAQVIDSFRDVQTARADKEKEINEAQAYANDIIPRARGNAAEMQEKAEAYRRQVEADAEGEAKRFSALYEQYKAAKDVTRKRIYLETMKRIYGDIDKVIINERSDRSSLVPYFPLNDLGSKNIKNASQNKLKAK